MNEVEVTLTFFGGVNTLVGRHNMYKVRMKNLAGDYACNFHAMDRPIICANMPGIKRAKWFDESRHKDISLTDLVPKGTDCNGKIDLLVSADIADKLKTGQKYDLSNGISMV